MLDRLVTVLRIAIAGAALAAWLPAHAAFYFGDTTGGPTFNRAQAGDPPSVLSDIGTDVAYDVFTFSVSDAGLYNFTGIAAHWDNMLFLYQGSFDPADALSNALYGADDFNNKTFVSRFSYSLAQGVNYVLVTTGFFNEDNGLFVNVIRGPGDILPAIPEPGTYAMLAAGLLAIGLVVRRRSHGGGIG